MLYEVDYCGGKILVNEPTAQMLFRRAEAAKLAEEVVKVIQSEEDN